MKNKLSVFVIIAFVLINGCSFISEVIRENDVTCGGWNFSDFTIPLATIDDDTVYLTSLEMHYDYTGNSRFPSYVYKKPDSLLIIVRQAFQDKSSFIVLNKSIEDKNLKYLAWFATMSLNIKLDIFINSLSFSIQSTKENFSPKKIEALFDDDGNPIKILVFNDKK
ncbi:MAG: hypothetical protein HYW78_01430 [Parcubacteria group bacterium]|nr:hypothetical protein [Parcubacteria group bacterium]